jgi:hypothetical protein
MVSASYDRARVLAEVRQGYDPLPVALANHDLNVPGGIGLLGHHASDAHRASRAQRGSAHLAAGPRQCVEEGRHGGFDPQADFGAQVRRGLPKGDVCVK